MLREGGWVDSGHPDAGLVDAVELGNEVFEVDVMVGVVGEGKLLEVPEQEVSKVKSDWSRVKESRVEVRDGQVDQSK